MIDFHFECRDSLVENVNTRFGLGDGIVKRGQAVYDTISGSIDPLVREGGSLRRNCR